jgi:hypothetical protein
VILAQKCSLSKKKDKSCEFVQIANDGERCALVLEWYEDTRVCNLDRCWLRMWSRDKLAWRNRMLKKKKTLSE